MLRYCGQSRGKVHVFKYKHQITSPKGINYTRQNVMELVFILAALFTYAPGVEPRELFTK